MLKYNKCKDQLVQNIKSGVWPVGTMLPKGTELIKQFGVSQSTLSSAMKLVVASGMIRRKRNLGTFVISDRERPGNGQLAVIHMIGIKSHSPVESLSWFINEQIFKGVVNNTDHKIRLISDLTELKAVLQTGATQPRGFILHDPAPEILEIVKTEPYVAINRLHYKFIPVNAVNADSAHTAYQALAYLVHELGHRRLAIVSGPGPYLEEYLAGCRMALRMFKLPLEAKLIVISERGGEDAGYQAGLKLLKQRGKFTAVFVTTDLRAFGVIKAFREAGLRVPEDVSVIGADDIPDLSAAQGLTTMNKGFYEMGKQAVQLLEQRLAEPNRDVPAVVVYSRLVQRQTCQRFNPASPG